MQFKIFNNLKLGNYELAFSVLYICILYFAIYLYYLLFQISMFHKTITVVITSPDIKFHYSWS
jgi:hypothetical protein